MYFIHMNLGFIKDDKESYAFVLEKLNVKLEKILHIGNNLKSDYFKPFEMDGFGKCDNYLD